MATLRAGMPASLSAALTSGGADAAQAGAVPPSRADSKTKRNAGK
jgi:hypothetical protein